MTTGRGDSAAPAAADDFLRDWQAVRADESVQYAPLPKPPEQKPPDWLVRFLEWLGDALAPAGRALAAVIEAVGLWGPALPWILLALVVAGAIWLAAKHLRPALVREPAAEACWTPDRQAALGLLGEAERLAGEGRYDEATHLLLRRSVEQIAEIRPELLRPSSTAREIAALPLLAEGARVAFSTIAERVERSLFALRPLDAADWQAAREAYARFALGPGARAA